MNKVTIKITITLLSIMLLTLATAAPAQEPVRKHFSKGQHHGRDNHSMPVVDMTMRAVRRLDLSDVQKENIKDIVTSLKAEDRELRMEMRAGHQQLKALIKADTFDEDAVADLAGKEGVLTSERLMIASRAMSQVYAQLTDEQRGELETMASERAERRAEHRRQRSDDV